MESDYTQMFKVADRIILELKSKEIYEGIYADGGKDRIVLTNVIQHNNKNILGGLYEFYRPEIDQIHKLNLSTSKINNQEKDKVETVPSGCDAIKIGETEYFRLRDMARKYIYIENVDKRYYEAVEILKDSETIGVISLGMEKHRSGSFIRLLTICTWKQIYIFDLIHLEKRQLYPELKDILESEYVCKVIHKSADLVDVLYRQYNIYVKNTFDTQIVDLILQKRETGKCLSKERNIADCLKHYLNFPISILEHALNVPDKKWNERPLSDKLKLYASQLVSYLIILKDYFQKLLLKDVYDTIEKVQDHVYDLDDFEYSNYVTTKHVSKDIQKIISKLPSSTNLTND